MSLTKKTSLLDDDIFLRHVLQQCRSTTVCKHVVLELPSRILRNFDNYPVVLCASLYLTVLDFLKLAKHPERLKCEHLEVLCNDI